MFELLHYLESTGDDFGLCRDGKCLLRVESETGHCFTAKNGEELGLFEAEYAPEDWWSSLESGTADFGTLSELREVAQLSAGEYIFGDVNSLQAGPSRVSSLSSPASSVRVVLGRASTAIEVEVDVDAETRLVGILIRPTQGGAT